jgi:hypothetical protein
LLSEQSFNWTNWNSCINRINGFNQFSLLQIVMSNEVANSVVHIHGPLYLALFIFRIVFHFVKLNYHLFSLESMTFILKVVWLRLMHLIVTIHFLKSFFLNRSSLSIQSHSLSHFAGLHSILAIRFNTHS